MNDEDDVLLLLLIIKISRYQKKKNSADAKNAKNANRNVEFFSFFTKEIVLTAVTGYQPKNLFFLCVCVCVDSFIH